jgi:epoxyqueuosine reductase
VEYEEILAASLRGAGIDSFGFLPRAGLLELCAGLEPALAAKLGLREAGGAVAAALPYGEGPGPQASAPWSAHAGPLARLARFARADWYAELRARLEAAAAGMRARLAGQGLDPGPARNWRYFANSRLPERQIALEAGLGRIGRHGLLMLPAAGSAAVLGLLLLPPALKPVGPSPREGKGLDPSCSGCGACVAACPTGALRGDGSLDRELCLQHWSSLPGPLPPAIEAAWGERLYGCDSCQEACPRFAPQATARTDRGLLGPGLPAGWLLSLPEAEIRAALKGSVLGMKWIAAAALRRSAALALRRKSRI